MHESGIRLFLHRYNLDHLQSNQPSKVNHYPKRGFLHSMHT